jgi:hypothetical protein
MNVDNCTDGPSDKTKANLVYIRHMLAELRNVAHREKADLLCYLIEMAYVEAGELHDRPVRPSVHHGKGH